MFEVIKKTTGSRIAICESPRFVKVNTKSGAFVQCKKDDAEGVAVNSVVYSLNGKLQDREEVWLNEIDTGEFVFDVEQQKSDILEIKDALCELDLGGE